MSTDFDADTPGAAKSAIESLYNTDIKSNNAAPHMTRTPAPISVHVYAANAGGMTVKLLSLQCLKMGECQERKPYT